MAGLEEYQVVNSSTGVNLNIFTNAITKYGDDVVHTPVTKTLSNIDGDETLTNGATASLRVYISRRTAPWMFDPAGLIQGGDAIMLAKAAATITKDDTILWNNVTYRVHNVLDRDQIGGNVAFTTCNLFKI